jgi:hypothetical protein
MKIHSMPSSSSTCYSHTKLIAVSTAVAAVVAKALDKGFRNSNFYYSSSAGLRRILAWATI